MLGKNLIQAAAGNAAVPVDPYWSDVRMLFVADGAADQTNSAFLDESSNAFTITQVNSPTQGSHTPYWDGSGMYTKNDHAGSGYFDGPVGTNGYLLAPSNATLTPGSNWNFHCWVKITSNQGDRVVFSDNSGYSGFSLAIMNQQRIMLYVQDLEYWRGTNVVSDPGGAVDVPMKTWTHISCIRTSGTYRVFVNGVLTITVTQKTSFSHPTPMRVIGAWGTSPTNYSRYYLGYIAGFSYSPTNGNPFGSTSGFTPPTTPPTSSDGLLLKFSNAACWDAKGINTFRTTGTVKAVTSSKFGDSSSMYFVRNGSGSNRIIKSAYQTEILGLGTSDFTLEFWVYVLNRGYVNLWSTMNNGTGASNGFYFGSDTSRAPFLYYGGTYRTSGLSVGNTAQGAWNHIVICRTDGRYRTYWNGVFKQATGVLQNNLTQDLVDIGFWFNGYDALMYLNAIRLTKNISRYTGSSYTVPTEPFPRQG